MRTIERDPTPAEIAAMCEQFRTAKNKPPKAQRAPFQPHVFRPIFPRPRQGR